MLRNILTMILLLATATISVAGVCPGNGNYTRNDSDAEVTSLFL